MVNNKPILIVGVAVVAILIGGSIYWSTSQAPAPEPVVAPAPQGQPSQNITPPPPTTVPVTTPNNTNMTAPPINPPPSTQPSHAPVPPPALAPAPAAASPSSINVGIVGFAFNPNKLTVKAGTKVIWTNNDGAPHTVTADGGAFSSPTLSQGQTFSFTFTTPGTYSYKCAIHPSMTAVVVVTQ